MLAHADQEQADEIALVLGGGLSEVLQLGDGLGGGEVVRFGSGEGAVGITENRLIAIGVAAVLIAGFFAVFKYSDWGVAMRASAERWSLRLIGGS